MLQLLSDLRARPIPDLSEARATLKLYRNSPIDETHSAYAERLSLATAYGLEGRNHYARADNPPYWRAVDGAVDALLVRESVGARLRNVDQRLRQAGLRLHLFDAWRPRAVQAYFYEVWTPNELRKRHPDWDDARIAAEVGRYWAAPTADPARPAPHATGGAIDLTIATLDGAHLYMGSVFDEVSELASPDHFENDIAVGLSFSLEEARANRRLLHWVMVEEGFAALPNEWWHFSYGDQIWAHLTGAPAAFYGLAEPDPAP